MPRGSNPKSRANLQKGRRFSGETARKAALKSQEVQAETKVFTEAFRKACAERPELIAKTATTILNMAAHGNIKACELVMKIMGEDPAKKLEVSGAANGPLTIRWMNSPDEKVGCNE